MSKVENFLQILECVRMGVGIRTYRIFLLFKNLEKLSFSISYIFEVIFVTPKLHKITFIYLMSMFFLSYWFSFSTDLTKWSLILILFFLEILNSVILVENQQYIMCHKYRVLENSSYWTFSWILCQNQVNISTPLLKFPNYKSHTRNLSSLHVFDWSIKEIKPTIFYWVVTLYKTYE